MRFSRLPSAGMSFSPCRINSSWDFGQQNHGGNSSITAVVSRDFLHSIMVVGPEHQIWVFCHYYPEFKADLCHVQRRCTSPFSPSTRP